MKKTYSLPDISIALFDDANITTESSIKTVDGADIAGIALNEKNIERIERKALDSLEFSF